MNKITYLAIVILFVASCNNNFKSKSNSEYVVVSSVSENGAGFTVTDINKDEITEVDAVKQLNDNLYLPISSSIPSFNGKIVEGYFVSDTNYYQNVIGEIFVVTNHKRDTTSEY